MNIYIHMAHSTYRMMQHPGCITDPFPCPKNLRLDPRPHHAARTRASAVLEGQGKTGALTAWHGGRGFTMIYLYNSIILYTYDFAGYMFDLEAVEFS